jgi:hypothetical protein
VFTDFHGIFAQQSAYFSRSNVHEKSADIDEHPYITRSLLARDREDELGPGIRVEDYYLTSEKSCREFGFSYFSDAGGRDGVDADSRTCRHVNGVEEGLVRVPETIDAKKLGMESLLFRNGRYDGFFDAFSVTQIDDRAGLKRSLSHVEFLLLQKGNKRAKSLSCHEDMESRQTPEKTMRTAISSLPLG